MRKLLNQTILLIYLIKRQKLYSLYSSCSSYSSIVRLSTWVENHFWEKKFAVRLSNWPPEWAFIREMANVSHLSSPVRPSRIDSNENNEKKLHQCWFQSRHRHHKKSQGSSLWIIPYRSEGFHGYLTPAHQGTRSLIELSCPARMGTWIRGCS